MTLPRDPYGSAELAQSASNGNREALEALLQRFLPDVRAFLRLRTGPRLLTLESPDDLVQSVCREALGDLSHIEYRSERAFKNWLLTTALNKEREKGRFYAAQKRDAGRERGQRERDTAIEGATDKLIKEFLPVLDNLERALKVEIGDLPEDVAAQVGGMRSGVEGVVQICRASLEKFDVVGFDAVGEIFDPNLHEAIRRVEDDTVPNNQVVEEYHRGYLRGERLLRAALVVVASGGPASDG